MAEQYSKVEIVTPRVDMETFVGRVFTTLFLLAFKTLIVWWFMATWFPELGLTYWQLILAVYAARMIFGNSGITPRALKK